MFQAVCMSDVRSGLPAFRQELSLLDGVMVPYRWAHSELQQIYQSLSLYKSAARPVPDAGLQISTETEIPAGDCCRVLNLNHQNLNHHSDRHPGCNIYFYPAQSIRDTQIDLLYSEMCIRQALLPPSGGHHRQMTHISACDCCHR